MEELLLKIYGPLDNVPSWHYSDAVKNTQEQKCEKTSTEVSFSILNSILSEIVIAFIILFLIPFSAEGIAKY